jgi:predicted permease
MGMMRGMLRQLGSVLRKARVERELDEELSFHVDMATEKYVRQGLPRAEARRQALLHFHGVERHKEAVRDNRWTRVLEDVLTDTRYAARSLARQPLLTMVAALTIAVGVGATASVFSMTRALLLAPLPVPAPEALYTVLEQRGGMVRQNNGEMALPYGRYEAYRDATAGVFSGLAAYSYATVALQQGGESRATNALVTSSDYFSVLGLRPAAGRFYDAGDDDAVVLSYAAWQGRFGGAEDVIGRVVHVDSRPYTVVGIAPREFRGLMRWIPTDVYLPFAGVVAESAVAAAPWFVPFGRLAAGVTPAAARDAVNAAALRIPPDEVQTIVRGARLEPLTGLPAFARTGIAWFMTLLFATAGLVLFIACANIAGILLARGAVRQREMAVRLAMGAGRGRLIRQLLTETVLLFALGGALGVLLAHAATAALAGLRLPFAEQVALDVSPDRVVLLFGFLLAVATGLIFGLLPAARAARPDLVPALKSVSGSPESLRARGVFVTAQLAMAVVLLIAAGLFVRSLQHSLRTDPGFDARNVMIVSANVAPHGYDQVRGRLFQQELASRVQALPGVEVAALAHLAVLGGGTHRNDVHGIGGAAAEPTVTNVTLNRVDEHFADAVRVQLVAGRWFDARDTDGAQPVVIVNEVAAAQLWPGRQAVGARMRLWSREHEVIGVVAMGRYDGLAQAPGPHAYLSIAQYYAPRVTLHIRARDGVTHAALLGDVRRVLQGLDPNVAPEGAMPLPEMISFSVMPQRFAAAAIGMFGAAGLLLAALGLYGVLAHYVAQRTPEFCIRAALGAEPRSVMRLVMGRALRLALTGSAIGLVAAAGMTRLLRALLTGVEPLDPVTFLAVPGLLIVTTLLAAALPARRALRADPLQALRSDT